MSKKPWHQDSWWISEYNYADEVRQQYNLPAKIQLHDATLRDGEQTPGVVLRLEEKVEIARMLSDLGVDRIEAGMPAVSQEDAQAIKEIAKAGLKSKIMVFSRAMEEDVDRAVDCGVWGIVLEAPSGYPKLRHQFSWTEQELIERCVRTIKYAKDKGLYVNFFPFDTTRAKLSFLERLLGEVCEKAHPDSITVVDTTGSSTPAAMRYLVSQVKKMVSVPLEVHTHNDFGLGTSTTLAAVEAGAEVVHGCINGLGERTGNTALEEIVLCLQTLYGYQLDFKFEKLYQVSQKVQQMAGIPVAANKPVVGRLPFTREIGLGMDVLKKAPMAIFPYLPELVGQQINIVMGKKSGKASVKMKLEEKQIAATEEQLEAIVAAVKNAAIQKKSILTPDEFWSVTNKVLG